MNSFHPPFSFDLAHPHDRPQKRFRDDDDDDDDNDIHPSSSYPSYLPDASNTSLDIALMPPDDDEIGGEDIPEDDGQDPFASLTSQALNPDGTPKRPMNAFMIFARRRRPEVSQANPSMRTGDISKILSKEWQSMEKSDKQFYLDKAKKLKDEFNERWPDYVYKRRPNNSRKRRKNSNAMRPDAVPYLVSSNGPEDVKPVIPSQPSAPSTYSVSSYDYDSASRDSHSSQSVGRRDSRASLTQPPNGFLEQAPPSAASSSSRHRLSISSHHGPFDPHEGGSPHVLSLNGSPVRTPPSGAHLHAAYGYDAEYNSSSFPPYYPPQATAHQGYPTPHHPSQNPHLRTSPTRENVAGRSPNGVSRPHRDSIASTSGAMWASPAQFDHGVHGMPAGLAGQHHHVVDPARPLTGVSPVHVGEPHRGEPGPLEGTVVWGHETIPTGRTTRNDSIASSSTRPGTGSMESSGTGTAASASGWMVSPMSEHIALGRGPSPARLSGRPHSNSVSSAGRPTTGSIASISRPHSSSFSVGSGRPSSTTMATTPFSGLGHVATSESAPELQHHQHPHVMPAPQYPPPHLAEQHLGTSRSWSVSGPSVHVHSTPTTPNTGSANQQGYGFTMLTSPFYPNGAPGVGSTPSGTPALGGMESTTPVGLPAVESSAHNPSPSAFNYPQEANTQFSQPPFSAGQRYSTSSAPEILGGRGGGVNPAGASEVPNSYSVGTTTTSLPTSASSPPVSTPPTPGYAATNAGGIGDVSPHDVTPNGMHPTASYLGSSAAEPRVHAHYGLDVQHHHPGMGPAAGDMGAPAGHEHVEDHHAYGPGAQYTNGMVPSGVGAHHHHTSGFWDVKAEPAL
ncbi:hypothetical protein FRB99_002080 [Tulasnella sp. 403]|nr:hypothetical protein FRB99_002080 [Tulasnella sp. 403]